MDSNRLCDLVALNLLPGLGPVLIRRCLERLGEPSDVAYRIPADALASVPGVSVSTAAAIVSARDGLRRRAETELRSADQLGLRLLAETDPDYPPALREIPDPPVLLYLWGKLLEPRVRVAVVGSRRATTYGRRVATGLASGLAARGIETVSGGARGIDSCAHLGALEGDGVTTAILGSGFLRLYPPENESLFRRIAERGSVVSEFPLEVPPLPENFPRRNRLISGLSAAVVVVEAAERSGSLSTAAHALEQGREVMAVPGPVSSEQSVGANRLIQGGAKLVQRVQDILDELSPMYAQAVSGLPATPAAPGPDLSGLSPDEARILDLFSDSEPIHLDALCDRAPFGIARLQVALLGLEVRGIVEQLPGRYYLGRLRREA